MSDLEDTNNKNDEFREGFEDKNLLILTNSYPDEDNRHYGGIFVKKQVRYLARYFNEIYVISPQPYGSNRNLRDYEHDNVRVYYPRFFHLPVEFFRKRLGDNLTCLAVYLWQYQYEKKLKTFVSNLKRDCCVGKIVTYQGGINSG
ncbi:hypothetical protein [Thermococcus gammatolerans]|uniref:Uncharacterized protein n=1 Tax=Thermococcus gammatolerans (strain DSM 15229 / JCM 11827 / EJ3) TaxID=593117 RepID=C5A2Y5_THEGJ|nr:hypothetical protein [Thermococcus gammatolerans]ACS34646.1 Hypothetical protein TGAM_2144 [Thermococcus gammatolerans EJ3]